MIDANTGKELQVFADAAKHYESLYTRFDEDFTHARGDKFSIDAKEGEWECVTSNRPQAEAWKMINILGSAERKLSIMMPNDINETRRKKIAKMEQIVNGFLFSHDLNNNGVTDPLLQFVMAFYRVVRGWGSYRLLITEDDDAKPYLDLAVWDTRNTRWISGKNGLLKVCYDRYISKESAEGEFEGFNGKADAQGLVSVHDIWDLSKAEGKEKKYGDYVCKNAIIAGTDYVKEPETVLCGEIALDHLPIRIRAGGTTPMIFDETGESNIAHVGESWIGNNRNLIPVINRVMSYKLTRAGMEAKMPQVITYDSSKGELPPNFKNDPFIKNSVIFLDIAKGQALADGIPMQPGVIIERILDDLLKARNEGGLSNIAFGDTDTNMTALGTDLLNRNTNQHILPFRKGMQEDFVWIAHETCKQFKNGSYDPVEFYGMDAKNNQFDVKGKPDDILDNQQFACELTIDELRDRATHSGMAIQEVNAGLISRREALEYHQLSPDPDRTLELVAREIFDNSMDTPLINGLLDLIKDYANTPNKVNEFKLNMAVKKLVMLAGRYEPQAPIETGDNTSTLAANRPAANLASSEVRNPTGGER